MTKYGPINAAYIRSTLNHFYYFEYHKICNDFQMKIYTIFLRIWARNENVNEHFSSEYIWFQEVIWFLCWEWSELFEIEVNWASERVHLLVRFRLFVDEFPKMRLFAFTLHIDLMCIWLVILFVWYSRICSVRFSWIHFPFMAFCTEDEQAHAQTHTQTNMYIDKE